MYFQGMVIRYQMIIYYLLAPDYGNNHIYILILTLQGIFYTCNILFFHTVKQYT